MHHFAAVVQPTPWAGLLAVAGMLFGVWETLARRFDRPPRPPRRLRLPTTPGGPGLPVIDQRRLPARHAAAILTRASETPEQTDARMRTLGFPPVLLTPEYRAWHNSPQWWALRDAALDRAHGLCELCQAEEATHVDQFHFPDDLYTTTVNDVRALCRRCHVAVSRLRAALKHAGRV
jgi:hypothetical protein